MYGSATPQPDKAQDDNQSPFLKAGRKQAKRLLKLAQDGQLNVSALHEAQAVVAKLHGYPNWIALTSSPSVRRHESNMITQDVQTKQVENQEVSPQTDPRPVGVHFVEQVLIDPPTHIKSLTNIIEDFPQQGTFNILSSHFNVLKEKWGKNNKVHFVSIEDGLATNLLLAPLGSQEMLALHKAGIVEVLLEMMGERKSVSMTSFIRYSLEQAFKNRSLDMDPISGSLKEKPQWMSPKAFSVLKRGRDLHSIAYYQAEKELIEEGLIEDAWQCHVRAMPTLMDIVSVLMSETVEYRYGQLQATDGSKALDVVKETLKSISTKHVGLATFNLPQDGTMVFEVDPIKSFGGLSAPVRWMYMHMLGNLRHVNKSAYLNIDDLPINAYDKPHEAQWVESIFPEQRDKVLKHLKQQKSLSGADLFDEMDGPICSEAVEDLLAMTVRESRKWSRGVWVCIRNTKSLGDRLVGRFMARMSLTNPRRLSDGLDTNRFGNT